MTGGCLSFNREGMDRLRAQLVRGASWSFVLKVISTGLVLATSILLARVLGPKGYGIYAYAFALVGLLKVPTTLGLPQLVLRNVAAYHARSEWGLMRGMLLRARQALLLTSIGIAAIAALLALVLREHIDPAMYGAFRLALATLPLAGMLMLSTATLRGLGYVVLGQVPDLLIKPVSLLVLIGVAYVLVDERFSPAWAMVAQVGATAIALAFGMLMLIIRMPRELRGVHSIYDSHAWIRSALPFLVIGGMQIINSRTDIVMLGALRGAEAAGIYRAATQAAQLVLFVLAATNTALQPTIARLYATKDLDRLQRVVTQSARVVLLISAPVAISLAIAGRWILLIFGQEFAKGSTALAILCFGQLVNASMGSVAILLNMTGHERYTARGVGIAAAVNVALNAILIPLWGINGAATATATSLVVWNLILALHVIKKIDIHPTALGRINLRRRM